MATIHACPEEEAKQEIDLLNKDGRTVGVHYYGFKKRKNQIDAIRRT